MGRLGSLVIRIEIDAALRAPKKGQANARHESKRGDQRLNVRAGRGWDRHCVVPGRLSRRALPRSPQCRVRSHPAKPCPAAKTNRIFHFKKGWVITSRRCYGPLLRISPSGPTPCATLIGVRLQPQQLAALETVQLDQMQLWSGSDRFLRGLRKKTGSSEAVLFGIVVDLAQNVGGKGDVDGHTLYLFRRCFNEHGNALSILGARHDLLERGGFRYGFAILRQSL